MHLLPLTVFAAEAVEPVSTAPLGIYETLIPLLLLLPIAGFAFTSLFGRRLQLRFGRTAAEIVPLGVIVATWIIAMAIVIRVLGHAEPFGTAGRDVKLWTWIESGRFV